MINKLGFTSKDAIRFTLLPEIFPRISKLFRSGFSSLSYALLVVFNTLRIVPNGHPFLRHDMYGKYSLFQAMAVAADNISFNRKNLDKIFIFGVILSGIAMIFLQIILGILALIAAPAYAYNGPGLGPRSIEAFFTNPLANPNNDIVFRLLDLVFGIPGIFTTNLVVTPFHLGLQALFGFYSFGILLIATFVLIYLATTVVLETAESGVPFGQRFNKAWVPIRIVLFFGLLLPMPNGINLGQYILLNAAKLGSNVATNAWITFDATSNKAYLGQMESLIAKPIAPDLNTLVSFMGIARTCGAAYGRIYGEEIRPFFVFKAGVDGGIDVSGGMPAFPTIAQLTSGGTVFIRFGKQDEAKYGGEPGAVEPLCGEISMPIVDQAQPGSALLQLAYLEMVPCLWGGVAGSIYQCTGQNYSELARDYTLRYSSVPPYTQFPDMERHTVNFKSSIMVSVNGDVNAALTQAIGEQVANGDWTNEPAMQLGWGGAGIWFNKIAEQNGAMTSSAMATPQIRRMPSVMEYIKEQKQKQDSNISNEKAYVPQLSSGDRVDFNNPKDGDVSRILNQVYRYMAMDLGDSYFTGSPETGEQKQTGNIMIDIMNLFMGTRGLFDMCDNANTHPLAQLAAIGKGAIEHSIASFGMAVGFGIGGGITTLMKKLEFGSALGAITQFFMTFAGLGLIIGFILFYVLPFLPFIYFFFAVMTWVKSIFEAMVGMPLWALAHLRIDGQGLPGDAANNGYFYILEIFLRPICIVISFIGAIGILSAVVKVLNNIFYLAVSNLTGHFVDPDSALATNCFVVPGADGGTQTTQIQNIRGTVDQFFYTVMYAIIVYMACLPCFKLVDLIPDSIMRWLGVGIKSFGAQDGDPAQDLMRNVTSGAGLLGYQLRNFFGSTNNALQKDAQQRKAADAQKAKEENPPQQQ